MPATTSRFGIFAVFLRLGLTSFGGPVAHIAYFRHEFVSVRRWLSERQFADLLSLCQFLPGPASSQLGMSIGLARGGIGGALAAFLGFTLPSALLMFAAARSFSSGKGLFPAPALHGLLLVAVAVVVQAVWTMGRLFCNSATKMLLAGCAAAAVLTFDGPAAQLLAIVCAGLVGYGALRTAAYDAADEIPATLGRRSGALLLAAFAALLVVFPIIAQLHPGPAWLLADSFFRSGALVFGGGHVILPLLHAEVAAHQWMPDAIFLAGYAVAQAMPGPLFSFAAFLGATTNLAILPVLGAAIAVIGIFAPSFFLVLGTAPFWNRLRADARARSILAGINAAVVGLLLAALYRPIGIGAVHSIGDVAFIAVALGALTWGRVPAWILVIAGALAGWLLG